MVRTSRDTSFQLLRARILRMTPVVAFGTSRNWRVGTSRQKMALLAAVVARAGLPGLRTCRAQVAQAPAVVTLLWHGAVVGEVALAAAVEAFGDFCGHASYLGGSGGPEDDNAYGTRDAAEEEQRHDGTEEKSVGR